MTYGNKTIAATNKATLVSYALGKHTWRVEGDSDECNEGKPYTVTLKMTGCDKGEFTCGDGKCVTMEQRCDQVVHCNDESDEKGCKLLILKESYNKNIPPINTVSKTNFSIVPVSVNITISLLKVVSLAEVDHIIQLQFEIMLEWRDNRLTYHNLHKEAALNALSDEDIKILWIPILLYDNTDQKDTTRLGEPEEWDTRITVTREGSPKLNKITELDETETFEGSENKLSMT